jgi:D-arabinose 5-phosphate isomerase GutQ
MKQFLALAFSAALLVHTDTRAMLRDAAMEHDLGGVRKSFEAMILSRSGQATDLRTARAVVRDAETPVR